MDDVTVNEMLDDLRSVKLRSPAKEFINNARVDFMRNGNLSLKTRIRIKKIYKTYNRQVQALQLSREKARRTNGRMKMGITTDDVQQRSQERIAEKEKLKTDYGF